MTKDPRPLTPEYSDGEQAAFGGRGPLEWQSAITRGFFATLRSCKLNVAPLRMTEREKYALRCLPAGRQRFLSPRGNSE